MYAYFVSCVNRLLPVGIVLFRYVYVCKVSPSWSHFFSIIEQVEWIENLENRKIFNRIITGLILGLSTFLTVVSYFYEEHVS